MASKLDGINAVRRTLPHCIFHSRCEAEGIAALETYRREWDDDKKAFKQSEVHDWSSHLSDAFRYLAMTWKKASDTKSREPHVPRPGFGVGSTILDGVIAPPLPRKR